MKIHKHLVLAKFNVMKIHDHLSRVQLKFMKIRERPHSGKIQIHDNSWLLVSCRMRIHENSYAPMSGRNSNSWKIMSWLACPTTWQIWPGWPTCINKLVVIVTPSTATKLHQCSNCSTHLRKVTNAQQQQMRIAKSESWAARRIRTWAVRCPAAYKVMYTATARTKLTSPIKQRGKTKSSSTNPTSRHQGETDREASGRVYSGTQRLRRSIDVDDEPTFLFSSYGK